MDLKNCNNVENILSSLEDALKPLNYVHALWLEGSFANGSADQYSDIDIYIDVDDDMVPDAWTVVEDALTNVAEIDYRYISEHAHPKLRQNVYHLKGTPAYLMIDFVIQLHSRDKDEYVYIHGDNIEAAKVIFDKSNIIRYRTYNLEDDAKFFSERIAESKYFYTQHSRVQKYILRSQMPEAYIYYNRYVIEPLVVLLRIKYTPAHVDYHMIHISSHLPKHDSTRLSRLIEGISLTNMDSRIAEARLWFNELLLELNF